MAEVVPSSRIVRFGTFEVDLQAGELRKSGVKLRLTGQPFQVLTILLERPGEVVTREELQKRLWPDTFVDVDHNLNTAINKIREVLGDSAESPRFVETLPRRGYRFIAQVEGKKVSVLPGDSGAPPGARLSWSRPTSIGFILFVILAAAGALIYVRPHAASSTSPKQRALTRVTFDDGLQIGATWSPDGRFIAYSSDRGGKFDIWVQQVSGGDPVQITEGRGQNWQPDWSPDGKYIAYRSEDGEGGLFVVPALGGVGLGRRIATFGYRPRWSPNASQILFQTAQVYGLNRIYVVDLDGSAPREIAAEFLSRKAVGLENSVLSAAWHPDGKRVSIWLGQEQPSPSFWTLPIAGGAAVKSTLPSHLVKQLEDVAVAGWEQENWGEDSTFSWAPSGNAIYFERTSRGVQNIWKMIVDPETLQGTAIERLTTGPGHDTDLAISAGGRMAFTAETQHIRAWVFPFDATRGRLTGAGQALTPPALKVAGGLGLTRDGSKLAFSGNRSGKLDLWQKSLIDGRESPIAVDDYDRLGLQWSPDGTRLAYTRTNAGGSQVMLWSSQSRNEEPLTTFTQSFWGVGDWSPDGKWILVSGSDGPTREAEILALPVAAAQAETASRKIASSPGASLWQTHFSPDGRWIVFEAATMLPMKAESTLYVAHAAGGTWSRLVDGGHWDDKPRWSPDGNMIYFVSDRSGSVSVWGIHFDAINGKPVGKPFRVTAFTTPALMLPAPIDEVELSITQNRLVLSLEDLSGSIWVLDNVGP